MMYYVNLAYQEALKSSLKKKYGAVLIYRNKVVGKGYNYGSCNLSNLTSKKCIL
jgi:deoxycytidylate deaminase